MNQLAKFLNSVLFQNNDDISDSECESEYEVKHVSIGKLMNSLYTQEDIEDSNSNSDIHSDLSDEYHRPRLVSLEGNIGAGKSTYMEALKQRYANKNNFLFVDEPVHLWEQICDTKGKNMIQKYYENPRKYAFAFQVMAFQTRLQLLKEAIAYAAIHEEITTIIMERSLDADYQIFAKMLFEEGLMEDVEHEIYTQMARDALREYGVDGIIWLDTDYLECFRRMEKRGREGEGCVEMNYLRKCGEYHVEWLGADLGMVCRIEGEEDSEVNLAKIDNYLH